MRRLAGPLLLWTALGCVPLKEAELLPTSQLGKVHAKANRLQGPEWELRLYLPNPAQSLLWQVEDAEGAAVRIEEGKDESLAVWRVSLDRWKDRRPFKARIRNQNGLDLEVLLGHPTSETTLHTAVVVILEILRPIPRL